MPALNHILHATDFTEHADAAFDLAWSLANSLGAKLTVLHVTKPPVLVNLDELMVPGGDPGQPAEVWNQLRARHVPEAQPVIQHKLAVADIDPAIEIIKCAEALGCDLVVMGTHGRRGLNRALSGSVAEEVVRRATCPVLTVKETDRTAATVAGPELEKATSAGS